MDSLSEIDARLAELLARRIELLGDASAPALEAQVEARAASIPAPLWRAVCVGTMAAAAQASLPPSTHPARTITIVGGAGAMGRLLGAAFAGAGHTVRTLDTGDWDHAQNLLGDADAAVIAVPIDATEGAIRDAAAAMAPRALLMDITSTKTGPVAAMLSAHPGPVLGLHPMFGPHVTSLMAQRVVACAARKPSASVWVLDCLRAQGATIVESTPEEHDAMMIAVQAIRHFTTLALGVFLAEEGVDVERSLDFASPIYRLEIDIVSRLFAQSPDLYISIMSASPARTEAIGRLAATAGRLASALGRGDHTEIRRAFAETARRLGPEAPRALDETTLAVEALSMALAARRG